MAARSTVSPGYCCFEQLPPLFCLIPTFCSFFLFLWFRIFVSSYSLYLSQKNERQCIENDWGVFFYSNQISSCKLNEVTVNSLCHMRMRTGWNIRTLVHQIPNWQWWLINHLERTNAPWSFPGLPWTNWGLVWGSVPPILALPPAWGSDWSLS